MAWYIGIRHCRWEAPNTSPWLPLAGCWLAGPGPAKSWCCCCCCELAGLLLSSCGCALRGWAGCEQAAAHAPTPHCPCACVRACRDWPGHVQARPYHGPALGPRGHGHYLRAGGRCNAHPARVRCTAAAPAAARTHPACLRDCCALLCREVRPHACMHVLQAVP